MVAHAVPQQQRECPGKAHTPGGQYYHHRRSPGRTCHSQQKAGAQLVGPLPGELGTMTLFTGGIGADSGSVPAVKALIEFLTGPEAAPNFKAKGFATDTKSG